MASLISGMGPYSLNNFCEYLEMPGLHQKTFNTIAKRVYSQNERLAEEIFAGAWIKRETPHCYEQWRQEHIEKGECTINFEGSSGMMEVWAAEVLWGRSVQRHNLCYTTMVSDGNSKAFNKLLEVQPYSPDIVILKEDCINHVGPLASTNTQTGHKQRVHTLLDYKLLRQHLELIYNRLSSVDLLRRCELKTTQNPNESFHHAVWSRCSKKNFHSLKPVEFALLSAAAEQNSGPTALSTIKTMLGFQEGEHGQRLGQARERKRVYKSSFEQQQKVKARKKKTAATREKKLRREAQHTRRACFEVCGDQNLSQLSSFFIPNFQS
ncbi:hypothetical protein PoB_005827300 [Plakobranchus ocellatus]|uniref:Mutator-like transposase domain-containing protein n=1 Tax=Plakobranchus ocellatus TaxID=259542 RepID=A0AAV4CKY0_9GAST|nr:hypothetical protein PoB_005827300 [Plakobranchus ocellatus]